MKYTDGPWARNSYFIPNESFEIDVFGLGLGGVEKPNLNPSSPISGEFIKQIQADQARAGSGFDLPA